MINNNYKLFALSAMSGSTATSLNVQYLYSPAGTTWNGEVKNFFTNSFNTVSASNGVSFILGTDNSTPASVTDYTLGNEISINNFTVQSSSVSQVTNLGDKKTYTEVLQYNGTDNISIGEIGMVVSVMNAYGSQIKFMVAREVLNTAIPISNGDTFTVSMTIG